jgi:hypothetical protein
MPRQMLHVVSLHNPCLLIAAQGILQCLAEAKKGADPSTIVKSIRMTWACRQSAGAANKDAKKTEIDVAQFRMILDLVALVALPCHTNLKFLEVKISKRCRQNGTFVGIETTSRNEKKSLPSWV